jgi:uncharacterized sporulation protein YeaH/YhbH (DUF444 family)
MSTESHHGDEQSPEAFDSRKARSESRDEQLLDLLAEGFTHAEAAEFAGCSTKIVQRRLLDDDFARELARRRAIRLDDLTGRLAVLSSKALTALEETLEVDNPTLRFRASIAMLNLNLRVRDEHETTRRLNRLEQHVSQQTNDGEFPRWPILDRG